MKTKKQIFLDSIEDIMSYLFNYNWKNNDELTTYDVNELIKSGEITKKEIIERITISLNETEGLK